MLLLCWLRWRSCLACAGCLLFDGICNRRCRVQRCLLQVPNMKNVCAFVYLCVCVCVWVCVCCTHNIFKVQHKLAQIEDRAECSAKTKETTKNKHNCQAAKYRFTSTNNKNEFREEIQPYTVVCTGFPILFPNLETFFPDQLPLSCTIWPPKFQIKYILFSFHHPLFGFPFFFWHSAHFLLRIIWS